MYVCHVFSYIISGILPEKPPQEPLKLEAVKQQQGILARDVLTAMPKRVMPPFSHSGMTLFLRELSCDSPSVTTTITLLAPERPPFVGRKAFNL